MVRSLAVVASLLLASGAVVSGCGSADRSGGDFAPRFEPSPQAERGGTLKVLASSDVDSLDPGTTNSQFGLMIAQATQRTLFSMSPGEGGRLVPDLAVELPRTDDPRGVVDIPIRTDARYSPPVGRRIAAGDFKYAIERSLLPGVANGYVDAYLSSLVGFGAARRAATANPREAPEIRGITTPDRGTLRLRFRGPVPPVAIQGLMLPVGAPVPPGYARPFDAQIPSRYGRHAVGTGPYMVANDDSGELTGHRPGIRTDLIRNPNWSPDAGDSLAFVDRVEIEHGYTNTGGASRRILDGESMVSGDFLPDPATLESAATEYPDQLVMVPARASLYASLNTTIPPLDDPDVRRAIVAATDRRSMQLVRGGAIIGPLATHFIPPGVGGFEDAGGLEGPGFDFLSAPEGDPGLATRYMRDAGYPDGTYLGDVELSVVTDTTGVGRRLGEVVRQAVESLGIPVRLQAVARDVMYSRYCNVPRAQVAVCPAVGWLSLLGDPQTMLLETFGGRSIRPVNNSNWSQLSNPRIDRQMNRARWIADPDLRSRAWGRIDREITSLAPAIPGVWSRVPVITSDDVELVVDPLSVSPSLTGTSLDSGSGRR